MGSAAVTNSVKYFIKKTLLVRSLCCLHNWLIDENDIADLPPSTVKDRLSIVSRGGALIKNENSHLNWSIGGGEHFDDVSLLERRRIQRAFFVNSNSKNPREYLLLKLQILGIEERPKPMGTTSTNNS